MRWTIPVTLATSLLALPAVAQVAVPLPGGAAPLPQGWAVEVDDDGYKRVMLPERAEWTVDVDDDGIRRIILPGTPTWTVEVEDDGMSRVEMLDRR